MELSTNSCVSESNQTKNSLTSPAEEDSTEVSNAMVAEVKKSTSSNIFIIFCVINSIIGSGIIALPSASQKAGFPLSILLSTFSGLITIITCYFLTMVSKYEKIDSYEQLVFVKLGKKASFFHALCSVVLPVLLCIAYGVAIVDNFTNFFSSILPHYKIFQSRQFVLFIIIGITVFPVCLYRKVSVLERISTFSIVLIIFYIFAFAFRAKTMSYRILALSDHWYFALPGVAQALGTISISFSTHHNLLHITNSAKDDRILNLTKCLSISVVCSGVLYYIVMCVGYYSFPGVVSGNILNSYCSNDTFIMATRIIFSLSILATYPLQVLSFQNTILSYFFIKLSKNRKRIIRIIITTTVIIVCVLIASYIPDIIIVIEIAGSLAAAPLMFIFPSLLYMKSIQKSFKANSFVQIFIWVIIIFGASLIVIGPAMSIYDFSSKDLKLKMIQYWC